MDYENRRRQIVRLQRIERKINEVKQRKNTKQHNAQVDLNSLSILVRLLQHIRISHNTSLVLKGAVVGFAITTIVWWPKFSEIEDWTNMIALSTSDTKQTNLTPGQHTNPPDIKQSNYDFDLINMRMELLTDYINSLEYKLTHAISLTESIIDIENKFVAVSQKNETEFSEGESVHDTFQATAPDLTSTEPTMEKMFNPTHTVNTKLNLRRSASTKATSIAVMQAGSKVEYIRQVRNWYYVNAPSYGEGWCSSEYLSSLLENQHYAAVN